MFTNLNKKNRCKNIAVFINKKQFWQLAINESMGGFAFK